MFLVTVATIWAVAAITPGPNFLVVVRCALTGSRAVAFGAVAGTLTGTAAWGLAGWLGISALFAAAPIAYLALKVAGGLYLVWLGLRLLQAARRKPDLVLPRPSRAPLSPLAAWRLGLITNLANPKSALFVASLFAATLPAEHHWSHGAAAVALMIAISSLWYAGLALALTHRRVAEQFRRAGQAIDAVTGAVFVGFGLSLVWSAR